MKIQTDSHKSNIQSLEEKLQETEAHRTHLMERNKALEKQKFHAMSESEHKYGDIIKRHESECE